jgi:hypothetical protein
VDLGSEPRGLGAVSVCVTPDEDAQPGSSTRRRRTPPTVTLAA